MEEMIKYKCEKCGIDYEKPANFKKWNEENTNVFFRWSLTYCDKCRREKERESLKALPNVLNMLGENFNKKD